MNFSYFSRLSCFAIILSPIIVSCKGDSSLQSVTENEKDNTFYTVNLSLLSASDSHSDKHFNRDTFTLKGTYVSCIGKVEGDTWILTKNKLKTSTLQIKKNDSNCKLKLTGFEFIKKESKTEIINYEFASSSSDTIKSYQLTKDFSLESKKFQLTKDNSGIPKELYINSKVTPENFNDKPTITVIFSELEIFNADEIENSIKYENATIYTGKLISLNENYIKAPDYEIENTISSEGFKVSRDIDAKTAIYEGKYKFKSTHIKATSYLIVGDIGNVDVIKYPEVDRLFKKMSSEIINNNSQSGNILEIDGALIGNKAGLPNKIEDGQIVKANIIFANTDSNGISSYKVASIKITGK